MRRKKILYQVNMIREPKVNIDKGTEIEVLLTAVVKFSTGLICPRFYVGTLTDTKGQKKILKYLQ